MSEEMVCHWITRVHEGDASFCGGPVTRDVCPLDDLMAEMELENGGPARGGKVCVCCQKHRESCWEDSLK